MTTRELLHAEIEILDDTTVDVVYQLVRQYRAEKREERSGDLLTMLKSVKIEGPPDFAANLDSYLYGDASGRDDVR
jgi:hypothetical protein